jgi:GH25 family lysozyme M1 (1,4-beta-N-acetylmuramidase)
MSKPEGVDVSTVGQGSTIDWAAVGASVVDFAFIKESQSTNFTDPNFTRNRQGAKAAGVISGAYHYWRPDTTAWAQIQHFVAVAGKWQPGDLPPCLDVELDPGEFPNYTPAQLVAHVRGCLVAMEQLCGKRPIIYTYPAFWRERMGNSKAFTDYPLWIASYPGPPPKIGGWTTHTFHQYTDRGTVPGIPHVDRNTFNGTLDELKHLCGIDTTPPETVRYFPETQHYVGHGFLEYFDANGGLAAFGYPITEEMQDVVGAWVGTVQYFQKARFEYHTEVNPPQVMTGLIGTELLALKP